MNTAQETIRIPVKARMEQQPDGSYRMVAAEYQEVSLDSVARLFWKAYCSERANKKGEATA